MSETEHQTAYDAVPDSLEQMASNDTPLEDVFPSAFVEEYTEAESIGAFFEGGSWSVSTVGDLDSVPLSSLDEHVVAQSTFGSWAEMARAATDEFAHRSSTY